MPGKKLVSDPKTMKSITCKQAVDFIIRKEEEKLSFGQRISLWRHLAICSLCRIFSSQNTLINAAMKKRNDQVLPLSDNEKEKIIQHVLNDNKE